MPKSTHETSMLALSRPKRHNAQAKDRTGGMWVQAHLHIFALPMPFLRLVNSCNGPLSLHVKFRGKTTRYLFFTIFKMFYGSRFFKIFLERVLSPNLVEVILVFC